ncbi:TPA: hypothetical protein DIT45_01465, partial [Candidatus Acetothermia bacterium]|nr:hypothetical protein [Candidatus Acetothermia bacterium]
MKTRLFTVSVFLVGMALLVPLLSTVAKAQPASIADAENVEFVGQIGGGVYAVAVQEDYAYIGDGPRLTILDVSDLTAPSAVGKTIPLHAIVQDVAVVGNYAYLAVEGDGLHIIDVSDLANPTEIGSYDTSGYIYGVAMAGGCAYVADGGLRIIDVSDPASPLEVGFYDTPGVAYDVAVAGNYAYIANRNEGLRIIDVSDPASPLEVSFYDTPGDARDVVVVVDYAYVADGGNGLVIIDVSNPASPTEVG